MAPIAAPKQPPSMQEMMPLPRHESWRRGRSGPGLATAGTAPGVAGGAVIGAGVVDDMGDARAHVTPLVFFCVFTHAFIQQFSFSPRFVTFRRVVWGAQEAEKHLCARSRPHPPRRIAPAAHVPLGAASTPMTAELAYTREAILAMLSFSLASSSLLLINKLCIHYVPVPAFISTAQFVSAATTAIVSLHAWPACGGCLRASLSHTDSPFLRCPRSLRF